MTQLTDRQLELLTILQEEAAEVIQIVSKIKRFGPDSYHPDDPTQSNLDLLCQEIGDFVAVTGLLVGSRPVIVTDDKISAGASRKVEKLKKFIRT